MLIASAAMLSAAGFIAFLAGNLFDYYGIAVIGGVIVLGVGATTMNEPLRYQSGETTQIVKHIDHNNSILNSSEYNVSSGDEQTYLTNSTAITNTSTVNKSIQTQYQYTTISTATNFSLGFLLTLLGALMAYQGYSAFYNADAGY